MSLFGYLPSVLDPRRRMRRRSYFAFHLAMLGASITVSLLAAVLAPVLPALPPNLDDSPLFVALSWTVSPLLALLGLIVMARRSHDIGWAGWLCLIGLIPVIGMVYWLALFLIPGTPGANRYGPDPRDEAVAA